MLLPVVQRELRVALLRRNARRQWLAVACIAGVITLLFLLFSAIGSASGSGVSSGSSLFRWLFGLAFLGIVSSGFALTADLFSEERRNGTLGLLVLTGLTPLEIFFNKLAGAMLLTSYGFVTAVPFFAIPFLAGGVPPEQFLCALAFLSNALVFCVSVGVLASVLHRESGQAQAVAIVLASALCLLAPMAYAVTAAISGATPQALLAASPIYGAYLVFGSFAAGSAQAFWLSSSFMLSYSIVALAAAALILQRTWRDERQSLAPTPWRNLFRKWVGVDTRWKRVLGTNPFCWLVARERAPATLACGFIATIALAWLVFWLTRIGRARNGALAVATAVVLHAGLNWILAYAAAKRLGQERQTGGFEILLTTPLSPRDIVEGQLRGMFLQFKIVGVLVVLLDLMLMCSGFAWRGWDPPIIVSYCLAWIPMLWFWYAMHRATIPKAMWIGAWTGRPGYSAIQSMRGYFWLLIWFGIPVFTGVEDYASAMCIGFFFVPLMAVVTSVNRSAVLYKLIYELRAIACAPIPSKDDPKFKRWNPKRIYPPGPWGIFNWRELYAKRG